MANEKVYFVVYEPTFKVIHETLDYDEAEQYRGEQAVPWLYGVLSKETYYEGRDK